MKKILALLTVFALLFSVSCGPDKPADSSSSASKGSEPAKKETSLSASFDDKLSEQAERPIKPAVNPEGIKNKVIAGYQGWFAAPGDGNKPGGWKHWNKKLTPSKEFGVKIDLYPDISEYDKVYKTDFKDFGNGTPASLFSSFNEQTVDTHFKWMAQYGVDCAAVQRFGSDITKDIKFSLTVMNNIKKASEKYGRAYYICYDLSGYSAPDMADRFINDFKSIRDSFPKIGESKYYLRQNGKPVVEIWGIAVGSNYKNNVEQAKKLVQWFKDNGYYVIGGVGNNWRKDEGDVLKGYSEVYNMFDMISPWLTGRFNTETEIRKYYETEVAADIQYCKTKGIDYMPVMFPGFSWANWYPGCSKNDRNAIPRRAGQTFWNQAKYALKSGATSYYLAMFDEYDEATAFAKAATDSAVIPTDYWFLTYGADSNWLSSDFYLRLIEDFKNISDGKKPMTDSVTIPHSEGPVYFRSSFERGVDVQARANAGNIKEINDFEGRISVLDDEKAYMGKTSVKFKGKASGKNASYMSAFCNTVDVPVVKGAKLRYYKYIENKDSANITVDIICTDGTKLSDLVKPADLGGGKVKKWEKLIVDLSPIEGKTIKTFTANYTGNSEKLECYFDDFMIFK